MLSIAGTTAAGIAAGGGGGGGNAAKAQYHPGGPKGHHGAGFHCRNQGLRGRALSRCVRGVHHLTFNASRTHVTPYRACAVERKKDRRRHRRWSSAEFRACIAAGRALLDEARGG